MHTTLLDADKAQKIADGIMKIIPYNINIMDPDGIIIASGDETRLGTVHQGAVKALEMKEPYVVYQDTETERKGINLPIVYNQDMIGVIGISGTVKEVMEIGRIVVVTAQLMVENQVYNDMVSIRGNRLKDFLYEWISLERKSYTGEFLDQANYLGVDLFLPRTAVIISCKRIRYSLFETIKSYLGKNEYIVRQRMEDALILFESNQRLEERLKKLLALSGEIVGCYIGESSTVASQTTKTAEEAYQMAQALGLTSRMVHYREVSLECLLSGVEKNREMEEIISAFEEKDPDGILQETICVYVESNHDYGQVCEKLHIHRNTLNYRLTKIEETMGYNPKSARHLMMLYMAIIKRKI